MGVWTGKDGADKRCQVCLTGGRGKVPIEASREVTAPDWPTRNLRGHALRKGERGWDPW